jgi:SAM-dependent methyltransferase
MGSLITAIRSRLLLRRMRGLSGLSIETAFDRIYERRIWSTNSDELSGGGSYGRAADIYVDIVATFIRDHDIQSILDIGCGDFNVGARIAPQVSSYYAFDVSAKIIDINKHRFGAMSNVEFRQANACVDPLVKTDLVTVRQVLQHLTNAQIEMILMNIERTQPRFVLITEHLAEQTSTFCANVDLPGHSSYTRVAFGSGVDVGQPPFSRVTTLVASIPLRVGEVAGGAQGETLGIFLLHPQF